MMKMMRFKFLIICLAINTIVFSQSNLFHKGDRVCFVGNSITNNGEFYHNILLYYATRFPDEPITFFNCGISGDVCSGVLKRMNSDILIHNPNYAVIKLGMNDVNRSMYNLHSNNNADTLAKREDAINSYKTNLDKIINIFLSKNIKVILQKPTIYDQTAVLKRENNFGVNDALKRCADYIQTLADKYKLPVVDYWTILNNVNNEVQKKDSTATIIGQDRIHPGSVGHLIMAYQFLKTINAPQTVAEIIIDNDAANSNRQSKNCVLSDFKNIKKEISFQVKENSLPFPTTDGQKQALELLPIVNDLSVEKFVVKGGKGKKELLIDNSIIGTFASEELANGINLTLYSNTPQYK